MQRRLAQLHDFVTRTAQRAFMGRPRALAATITVIALVGFFGAGFLAWFAYDLTSGLPSREALHGVGDMSQSTTLFDAHDRPVFTIFKEQRIEIPFAKMSPNPDKGGDFRRGPAILRSQRHRCRARGRRHPAQPAGRPARRGREHDHQQLARLSFLSRGKTYRRKPEEVIVAAH